jgi:hypothetical protein
VGSIPITRSSDTNGVGHHFSGARNGFYELDEKNGVRHLFSSCPHSSVVEHFLGKEEVTGSSPVVGSIKSEQWMELRIESGRL